MSKCSDRRLARRAPAARPSRSSRPSGHPVPRELGELVVRLRQRDARCCFILQIVTGICLALVYVPSASEAWDSLIYLNYQQPLGWFLRALHGWGSNFMVAMMIVHMMQVFLFGAYKYPRELTWVAGCVLLLVHARHGVHRPGAALRPGRVLGTRHRRRDRWAACR